MTNHILGLIFILLLSACRPLPGRQAVGSEELAPYYKGPEPARIVINDKTYNSGIGDTKWIKLTKDGTRYMEFADAFAIITPTEPIVLPSNPSLTLKLPIPINPVILWYSLFKVPEQDLVSQVSSYGSFRWNPDHETQTYYKQIDLALLSEQELTLALEPGIYVFEVHAGWGNDPSQTELEADYGFLFKVQE